MKRLLVVLVAMAACLAFVAPSFAGMCGFPPVGEMLYKTPSKAWAGKWKAPAAGPITAPKCVTPKCGPCYTVPGSPYAVGPILANLVVTKTADVMVDLCIGKAKGECPLGCGPCAPKVKWAGSWKTSEIVGKTTYQVMLPPAYRWCGEDACPAGPVSVKAFPKPPTPQECY